MTYSCGVRDRGEGFLTMQWELTKASWVDEVEHAFADLDERRRPIAG